MTFLLVLVRLFKCILNISKFFISVHMCEAYAWCHLSSVLTTCVQWLQSHFASCFETDKGDAAHYLRIMFYFIAQQIETV